jgi:hypothetical protein
MNKIISNISVDCVIFGIENNQLKILLAERTLEKNGRTVFSDYSLLGDHIFENENMLSAAKRILVDLIGENDIYLEQFETFGEISRANNPNDILWKERNSDTNKYSDRIFSIGYFSLIDITKVNIQKKDRDVKWFSITDLPQLGYDHEKIIKDALIFLKNKIIISPIIFELLPDKFSISQLQSILEEILNIKYDRRNFRKRIIQKDFIVNLNEKQKGVPHKPAQLYMFSRDIYEKTKKDNLDFIF